MYLLSHRFKDTSSAFSSLTQLLRHRAPAADALPSAWKLQGERSRAKCSRRGMDSRRRPDNLNGIGNVLFSIVPLLICAHCTTAHLCIFFHNLLILIATLRISYNAKLRQKLKENLYSLLQ